MINRSRIWLVNHLCHQDSNWLWATGQNIRYGGINCALRPSKSICYSGVCFHIFYCNSARLSNVVRYNRVFLIAGCHCITRHNSNNSLMPEFNSALFKKKKDLWSKFHYYDDINTGKICNPHQNSQLIHYSLCFQNPQILSIYHKNHNLCAF